MKPETLNWQTAAGKWTLDFSRPVIMSIINLTPDSFSDGGRFQSAEEACQAALAEVAEGADILDLGAESTRPGSETVGAEEEWARVEPVLRAIRKSSQAPISIDTYRAEVAEKAILAGASIINDIYAGRKEPDIVEVAVRHQVPLVLMHMKGDPANMQEDPRYEDVVREVHDFLLERARYAESRGLPRSLIILDPGLGFGKNLGHNLSLLKHFGRALPAGYRSLMGLSRKAFLGRILGGAPPRERDGITAAAVTVSVLNGADIVRVHRAQPNREGCLLAQALLRAV